MNLSVSDVENYLEAVKCAVKTHRYRLDLNAMDFSDAVPNEHVGYEHETLYIFGKTNY